MTFLPVVERELRAAARLRTTFRARLVFAVSTTVFAMVALAFLGVTPRAGQGGGVFRFMAWVSFGYALFAGVFLTADCLSREKREGTLGLMFLTDLQGYDVVLGKLVARSLTTTYGLLSVVPVMSVLMLLGGVTGGELWRVALASLGTLFVSLSLGMLASTLAEDDQWALGGGFALICLLTALPPLFSHLWFNPPGPGEGIAALSPWSALVTAFDVNYRLSPMAYWRSIAWALGLGGAALFASCLLLPRIWREGGPWPVPRLMARRLGPRRLRRAEPIRSASDAVAWLTGRSLLLRPAVVAGIVVVVLGVMTTLVPRRDSLTVLAEGLGVALRCLLAVAAGRFFLEARRDGGLELLVCSPLTPRELLEGQWRALRARFLPPAALAAAIYALPVVLGMLGWAESPGRVVRDLGAAVYGIATLTTDLLAAGWVGLWLGLTARRLAWVPGLAILYAVLLPELAVCVPNLLIDMAVIAAARDRVERGLRGLSRIPYDLRPVPHSRPRIVPPSLPAAS